MAEADRKSNSRCHYVVTKCVLIANLRSLSCSRSLIFFRLVFVVAVAVAIVVSLVPPFARRAHLCTLSLRLGTSYQFVIHACRTKEMKCILCCGGGGGGGSSIIITKCPTILYICTLCNRAQLQLTMAAKRLCYTLNAPCKYVVIYSLAANRVNATRIPIVLAVLLLLLSRSRSGPKW